MSNWIADDTARILFPGASVSALLLMERGDLVRVLPDWQKRLGELYETTARGQPTLARCKLAWIDLLAAYDAKMAAHEAQKAENP
jgi:hypothetical protein